jgi:acid stress-induced BolA-like protein IbaG/YrbA
MTAQELAQLIHSGLTGSTASVRSEDNVHFEAVVISPAFAGKRPVQRHQLVYAALGGAMASEIHALALQAFTPEEFAAREQRG